MRLQEIIQPHTPVELTHDYLKDPLNGVITNRVIRDYNQFLIETNKTQLLAHEQYSQNVVNDTLDTLLEFHNGIPDEYIKNNKAGKMLLEMIAYFEGR